VARVPATNQIRIIGGAWRGRRVRFPAIADVRPTPDRVRETLFNWLGQDLTGARTLDLFAGSGALSLEALSRGAALAVAVDRHRDLARALAATGHMLEAFGLETHCADAQAFVARERRTFDIVFLDPPFASSNVDKLLGTVSGRLAPRGLLYLEAPADTPPPAGFTVWRRDRAGQVHYHLMRRIEVS
jgi:16S rRNA (guanine966-N2)-methyltransferase